MFLQPDPAFVNRWGVVATGLPSSRAYAALADRMRAFSDGAWWTMPWLQPAPLLVIGALMTVVWTLRTALLVVLLMQVTSMTVALSSRTLRLWLLRRTTLAFAGRTSREGRDAKTSWHLWHVPDTTRQRVELLRGIRGDGELVIGRIDRNGRVLGVFGRLPDLPATTAAEFASGTRFQLDVVLIGDQVLIRKDFRGDRIRFYAELSTLTHLMGRVNVPAVHRVDARATIIYKDLIAGETIRDLLVKEGARILGTQTADDPQLQSLPLRARKRAIEARGTALLRGCLPERTREEIERQILLIHSLGVTGVSHTFQNVVIDASGSPWFIDCENGRIHRSTTGWRFRLVSGHERMRFVQRYGEPRTHDLRAHPLTAGASVVRPRG